MPWLRFGLLVLVLTRIVFLFGALRRRFAGKRADGGGEAYEYSVSRGKNRVVTAVRIGLDLPDTQRFLLRREGLLDRVAKWLGIAREWQTHDSSFDDAIFILSDDRVLLEALSFDRELRLAAERLFGNPQVKSIECARGYVWVTLHKIAPGEKGRTDEEIAVPLAAGVRPNLATLRDRLRAIGSRPWTDDRDPALEREHWLLIATSVIGIAGIAAFFWGEGLGLPRQLVFAAIESHAMLLTLIAGAILLALLVSLIGRTSRTHLVLMEILLVALPGAWFAGRALYTLENERLDRAPVTQYVTRLADVYTRRGSRSTSYYLVVEGWPDERFGRELKVRASVYARFRAGDCARFDLHRGYFGDPWLSAIEPDDGCAGSTPPG